MDINKVGDYFSKSSVFSDVFGYLGKAIAGFFIIVQLFFFAVRNYSYYLVNFDISKYTPYQNFILIILVLSLSIFVGTLHISILESIVYIYSSVLMKIRYNNLKSMNKLQRTSKNKLQIELRKVIENIVVFFLYPFVHYYGVPAFSKRDESIDTEFMSKFVDYFKIPSLSYKQIDMLADALLSKNKINDDEHIHDFHLSLLRGGVVNLIYFFLYFIHLRNVSFATVVVLMIILLQIVIRKKNENRNCRQISEAYLQILTSPPPTNGRSSNLSSV